MQLHSVKLFCGTGLFRRLSSPFFLSPLCPSFSGAPQEALIVKNPPANAGDVRDAGSIPGSGRSPGEDHSPISVLAWRIPWTEEASGHESQNYVPGMTVLVAQSCPTLPPHGL